MGFGVCGCGLGVLQFGGLRFGVWGFGAWGFQVEGSGYSKLFKGSVKVLNFTKIPFYITSIRTLRCNVGALPFRSCWEYIAVPEP